MGCVQSIDESFSKSPKKERTIDIAPRKKLEASHHSHKSQRLTSQSTAYSSKQFSQFLKTLPEQPVNDEVADEGPSQDHAALQLAFLQSPKRNVVPPTQPKPQCPQTSPTRSDVIVLTIPPHVHACILERNSSDSYYVQTDMVGDKVLVTESSFSLQRDETKVDEDERDERRSTRAGSQSSTRDSVLEASRHLSTPPRAKSHQRARISGATSASRRYEVSAAESADDEQAWPCTARTPFISLPTLCEAADTPIPEIVNEKEPAVFGLPLAAAQIVHSSGVRPLPTTKARESAQVPPSAHAFSCLFSEHSRPDDAASELLPRDSASLCSALPVLAAALSTARAQRNLCSLDADAAPRVEAVGSTATYYHTPKASPLAQGLVASSCVPIAGQPLSGHPTVPSTLSGTVAGDLPRLQEAARAHVCERKAVIVDEPLPHDSEEMEEWGSSESENDSPAAASAAIATVEAVELVDTHEEPQHQSPVVRRRRGSSVYTFPHTPPALRAASAQAMRRHVRTRSDVPLHELGAAQRADREARSQQADDVVFHACSCGACGLCTTVYCSVYGLSGACGRCIRCLAYNRANHHR